MRDYFAFWRGHLATSGDIFVFQDCRDGCATDIEQVEIRDAAKHLKMVRKQQKNYLDQNVSKDALKIQWSEQIQKLDIIIFVLWLY